MKLFKVVSLIALMFSIASAVTNWGGDLTKNPVAVFWGILLFAASYGLAELVDGKGE